MSSLDFPSNPSTGDLVTLNGRAYEFNGDYWVGLPPLGAQGPQGASGPGSFQGFQGPVGNDGPAGVQGVEYPVVGPQGPQGIDNSSNLAYDGKIGLQGPGTP